MRLGRILIYLALIIIVVVAAVALYLWRRPAASPAPVATQTTPQVSTLEIVSAGQNISPGTLITAAMLDSMQINQDHLKEGEFKNKADVVNMYARSEILQGSPITASQVSLSPILPGSPWAPFIPQGMTAVSIPITRLSAAAFGIGNGDYVDVIATLWLVDVDPALQTILPNNIAGMVPTAATTIPESTPNPTFITPLGASGSVGEFETVQVPTDPASNMLLYVQPSEKQRARMVTQMIMQNIQVLNMGTFPLPSEPNYNLWNNAGGAGISTPTPLPANQTQAAPTVVPAPDIITVIVTPQDAVTLTYLLYSDAKITLSLRNPNDNTPISQPDAAMLEYLLTQYNIPVPSKLPYALQPGVDALQPTSQP